MMEMGDPRTPAAEMFRDRLRPLLDLISNTAEAEEVFMNGDRLWMAVGAETVPVDWGKLGKMTPERMRGAMRNAAVFGEQEFGPRLPASPKISVKIPPRWRVSAVMPPASDTWQISIRHLMARSLTLDDYAAAGIMTCEQQQEIEALLDRGANTLVSGGTRAGKTTLMGAMIRRTARNQRTIVIESTPELVIEGRDVSMYQECPGATMADLLVQALRMGPERIVVGEVREPHEALEMVTAMNTGHQGVICTIHSNGAERALRRLHTQCCKLQAGFPYEEIAENIDAVVQISGYGKARKVTEIWHAKR